MLESPILQELDASGNYVEENWDSEKIKGLSKIIKWVFHGIRT